MGAAGWKHRPVPAPPANLRPRLGDVNIKQTGTKSYYSRLEDACTYGISCKTPGYVVQWPYVDNGLGQATFPAEMHSNMVGALCRNRQAEPDGYMWDYFNSQLLDEYYACNTNQIPFKLDNVPFHFRTDWYEQAHQVTLDCMGSLIPNRANWAREKVNFNGNLRPMMEKCFLNHASWQLFLDGGLCDCKTTKAIWAMSQVTATPSASTPSTSATPSTSKLNINQHNLYGCFFTSPTAAAPVKVDYDSCGSIPAPKLAVGIAPRYFECSPLRVFECSQLQVFKGLHCC